SSNRGTRRIAGRCIRVGRGYPSRTGGARLATPGASRRWARRHGRVGAEREARVKNGRQIVIVPIEALDADRIARLAQLGVFTVCFLAGSYSRYTALRKRLPPGWELPSPGPALNEAAKRLRDAVINLDAQAQPETLGRKEWDASLLAERGPL